MRKIINSIAKYQIIFHQPRFPWNNKGSDFPKPKNATFWVIFFGRGFGRDKHFDQVSSGEFKITCLDVPEVRIKG